MKITAEKIIKKLGNNYDKKNQNVVQELDELLKQLYENNNSDKSDTESDSENSSSGLDFNLDEDKDKDENEKNESKNKSKKEKSESKKDDEDSLNSDDEEKSDSEESDKKESNEKSDENSEGSSNSKEDSEEDEESKGSGEEEDSDDEEGDSNGESDEDEEDGDSDEKDSDNEDSNNEDFDEDSDEDFDEDSNEDSDEDSDGEDSDGEEGDRDSNGNEENSNNNNKNKDDDDNFDEENKQEHSSNDTSGEFEVDEEELDDELYKDAEFDNSKEKTLKEEIRKIMENLPDNDYTADTTNDIAEVPKITDWAIERLNELKDRVKGQTAVLVKTLQQKLLSITKSRRVNDQHRGKLNVRSLARAAKGLTKNPFYKIEKGQKIDTAVSVIFDESGSMDGSMYDNTIKFISTLSEALASMSIPFEIMGATTRQWGMYINCNGFDRTVPIVMYLYKTFRESYYANKNKLAGGFTHDHKHFIDGECIDLCAQRLAQQKATRKILFVLSDGSTESGQGHYDALHKRTQDAIKRAQANGIEVVAFGLQTRQPEQTYGKENFVYIQNVEKLDMPFLSRLGELLFEGRKSRR